MDRPWQDALRLSFVALTVAFSIGCGGGGGDTPANFEPVLQTTDFKALEDTDLTARIVGTHGNNDSLVYAKTSDPGRGTITAFNADGSFVYQPRTNVNGPMPSTSLRATEGQGHGRHGPYPGDTGQ
jgi:hypothetical protein